tara:strand:+ start:227 stop:448 length:222 start_codon:yes stop_codon:yes gene_type:complete
LINSCLASSAAVSSASLVAKFICVFFNSSSLALSSSFNVISSLISLLFFGLSKKNHMSPKAKNPTIVHNIASI